MPSSSDPLPLQEVVDQTPRTPGVYFFKDRSGTVLYIGKAKNLRSRLQSYFRTGTDHPLRTRTLLEQVRTIDTLETESEVDALLMESRLIKDIQPRFNVRLRDGKSYPYLVITRREEFPRVFVARESEFDPKRVTAFGPFTDVGALRKAHQVLQRIFRFRTCEMPISENDPQRAYFRPCLLYNIDQCLAPCGLFTDKATYRKGIRDLKRFLRGGQTRLLHRLEREMQRASDGLDFETAARLRDQIADLARLTEPGSYGDFVPGELLHVDPRKATESLATHLELDDPPRMIQGLDMATIQGSDSVGALVAFLDGVPFKSGYRRFRIRQANPSDDYAMMREVVRRHFLRVASEKAARPDLLLLDGGTGHLNAVLAELRTLKIEIPPILALSKQHEEIHRPDREPLRLPRHSKALHLLQYVRDEAHRFAQGYHRHLRHRRTFGKTTGSS